VSDQPLVRYGRTLILGTTNIKQSTAMGILNDGPNGSINGKIGAHVVYEDEWGRQIIRTIGVKNGSYGGELANQQGTALTTNVLKPIRQVVEIGFKNVPPGKFWSAYNYASSYTKINAVTGTYPNKSIDFTKLMIAKGGLPLPLDVKVKLEQNVLEFTWNADLEIEGNDPRDQVMLVAYFRDSRRAINLLSGARREAEKETIKLPRFTKRMVIETYLAFVSDDRERMSDSVYAGQVIWDKND
jgi:hypothetical protein